MGIKKLTPTSPARRYQTYLTRDELTPNATPEKIAARTQKRISGRNSDGRITVRRRGGGHKRFYRIIDFKRNKTGIPGRVTQIEYDPNRSAHIALITYLDGEKRYILAPVGLEVGKMIMSGPEADILPGNTLPIKNIPLGTQIHNIEMRPGKGGQMARSAGVFAQLVAKDGDYAQLRMPSGEVRRVPVVCTATVGQVGNVEHENESLGKPDAHAGRYSSFGSRCCDDPVDHRMAAVKENFRRTSPGNSVGQPTRGYKTRNNKRTQNMIVRDRRSK
jgi:large subunit ribosomal protein L2